jgi:hypothetical protein
MEIEALEKGSPAKMSEEAGAAAARIIELARADGIAVSLHELTVDNRGSMNLAIWADVADVGRWRLSKRREP